MGPGKWKRGRRWTKKDELASLRDDLEFELGEVDQWFTRAEATLKKIEALLKVGARRKKAS